MAQLRLKPPSGPIGVRRIATAQIRDEEIFGPVLPILTFDSLDTVIAEIDAGARPLAKYVA